MSSDSLNESFYLEKFTSNLDKLVAAYRYASVCADPKEVQASEACLLVEKADQINFLFVPQADRSTERRPFEEQPRPVHLKDGMFNELQFGAH